MGAFSGTVGFTLHEQRDPRVIEQAVGAEFFFMQQQHGASSPARLMATREEPGPAETTKAKAGWNNTEVTSTAKNPLRKKHISLRQGRMLTCGRSWVGFSCIVPLIELKQLNRRSKSAEFEAHTQHDLKSSCLIYACSA